MREVFKNSLRWSIFITVLTFFLAILISIISTFALSQVGWGIGFLIVLFIVFIGIFFDILGIAATSAEERPYHSMAAEKVPGSRQALNVIRNADQFSNFCNDVVGDISGIVSGAAAVAVVTQLLLYFPSRTFVENMLNVLLTGFVAALTVGGKAVGKSVAIHYANPIILQVGKFLFFLEERLHLHIFDNKTKNNKTKKSRQKV